MSPDWSELACRLADQLAAAGALHDPVWHAAVAAVPRHVLVPGYHEQAEDRTWRRVEATDPAYWDAVYADQTLLTALAEVTTPAGVQRVPVSSSTQPSLMVRILEKLDLLDGHRVLEIGTGTGYNAALLAVRLGDQNVYSVDLHPELADAARQRLAGAGYHPTLVVRDGWYGLAEHAPYDRILATCAVPAIPAAWLDQTRPGGLIMADVQGSLYAGNLVTLHRLGDRAEGRFQATWAGFMPIRHDLRLSDMPGLRVNHAGATQRCTAVGPQVLDEPVFAFFTQLHLPAGTTRRTTRGADGRRATQLLGLDGSWCEADQQATTDGRHRVREAGAVRLWALVEQAYDHWQRADRPGWQRFGITATATTQRVWLDDPGGETWPLAAVEP